MSITNDVVKAEREAQILVSLDALEKSLILTRETINNLQSRLDFVSFPAQAQPNAESKEGVQAAPVMSECARKVWELNSYVYFTNKILTDVLCHLDM